MKPRSLMIIYKVVNRINGKCYVGQTVRKFDTRIYWHIHSAKVGPTSFLHRAIRKYGPQSFEWFVIDTADTRDVLNQKERYWIWNLNTMIPNGYNMTEGGTGGANNKGKSHSKDTILKMSKRHMGEANPFFGRHHSEENMRKMSERLRGNKHLLGHKHTEETRHRMSESHKCRYEKQIYPASVIAENPEKEDVKCQMN